MPPAPDQARPTETARALTDYLLQAFATLVVIIDPIALAPIFLGVTRGQTAEQRRKTAITASLTATGILVGFALVGAQFLELVGISIPAFRIAGALLMFAIAFEMVFEKPHERSPDKVDEAREAPGDVSVFPLAIPLTSGPGAISATVLISSNAPNVWGLAGVIAIILGIMAVVFVIFATAGRIARVLGTTGQAIVTRLLGVLLAALAVQFVADGVRALVTGIF